MSFAGSNASAAAGDAPPVHRSARPGRKALTTLVRGAKAAALCASVLVSIASFAILGADRQRLRGVWFESGISPAHRAWLGGVVVWSHRWIVELDRATYDSDAAGRLRPHWNVRRISMHNPGETWSLGFESSPSSISWLGCKVYHYKVQTLSLGDAVETRRGCGVTVPCLLLGIIAAPPGPIWVAHLMRRRSRRRRGACIACGYDLRASEGCCPECGRPIPRRNVSPPLPRLTPGC